MSSEHRAFASLSSGLLARKGSAKPAMRRQGFGEMGQGLDDLGWNDMGGDETPAPSPGFNGDPEASSDGDKGVLAALGPLAGLSAAKAVQDHVQSVSQQASSVREQQEDIAAHFSIPEGEESDDGADLEDETAEVWDPEAEDDGNVFNSHLGSVNDGHDDFEEEEEASSLDPMRVAKPELPEYETEFASEDEEAHEFAESHSPVEAREEEAPAAEEITEEPTVADVVPMPVRQSEPVQARRPSRPRAEPGSKEKAAFTLRLDKQRHLRLRLASALTGRSAQKMLIEALDKMLDDMPELDGIADRSSEVGSKTG